MILMVPGGSFHRDAVNRTAGKLTLKSLYYHEIYAEPTTPSQAQEIKEWLLSRHTTWYCSTTN